MKTPSSQKLAKLEALRGGAAFYVMLGHTFSDRLFIGGRNLSFLLDFGQEAVILFFILSGFVIQYSFERANDKSFTLFFAKRFLRIYIPLIIVFIVNYFLVCFQQRSIFYPDWMQLTGNILMLQDAGSLKPNVICGPFLGNSPLWSLSYEWWFYMLFFFIVSRNRKQASLIVYSIGLIAATTYFFYPNFINRILMYMIIWWIGADIAILYLNGRSISLRTLRGPLLALLATTLILILNAVFNKEKLAQQLGYSTIGVSPYLELRHFAFSFISILCAILWRNMKWIFFDKTIGIFGAFAKISFGVYISHWFLVAQASYLDGVVENGYLRYALYFAVCFLFSFVVERKIYPYLNNLILQPHKRKEIPQEHFIKKIA